MICHLMTSNRHLFLLLVHVLLTHYTIYYNLQISNLSFLFFEYGRLYKTG